MRLLLTIVIFSLTIVDCKSQINKEDIWIRFEDTTKQIYGFKDLQGEVKVSPRYWGCPTDTFRTIAFVGMEKEGWVCIDKKLNTLFHPYIWDNGIDRFQSGLIRIQEKTKMGFADTTGKIIIPAIYDFVTPFDRNFAAFLSRGKYKCWEKGVPDSLCEHKGWKGGIWGIINKNNDTLIPPSISDSVFNYRELNIASLTDKKVNSSYVAFAGNGKTYFMEDVRLSFNVFFNNFLKQVEQKNTAYLKSVSYPNIICTYCLLNTEKEYDSLVKAKLYTPRSFYTDTREKEVFSIDKFIKEDFNLVFSKQAIANLRDTSITQTFIEFECGNYLFPSNNDNLFSKYLDNNQRYYKIEAVVNHYTGKQVVYQEHFGFLKTEHEYKFISYARTLDGYGK